MSYVAHGTARCRVIGMHRSPRATNYALTDVVFDHRPRPIDLPPTHPLHHVVWVPRTSSLDCSFITDTEVFTWTVSYMSSDISYVYSRSSVDALILESNDVDTREWPLYVSFAMNISLLISIVRRATLCHGPHLQLSVARVTVFLLLEIYIRSKIVDQPTWNSYAFGTSRVNRRCLCRIS